jgi:hypothetical protein
MPHSNQSGLRLNAVALAKIKPPIRKRGVKDFS